jgi:hypothetical protein
MLARRIRETCLVFIGRRKSIPIQRMISNHVRFMFHQANMRSADVESTSVNGQELQMSLLEIWTEVITQEMVRL